MEKQIGCDPKTDDALYVKEPAPFKSTLKTLRRFNIFAEVASTGFHILLILMVPKHYPYFQNQFLVSIGVSILHFLIILKMKMEYLRLQVFFSFAHFIWLFYVFATVPVFITAISTSLQECDPVINTCVKGIFNLNAFQVKMVMGLTAQMFYLGLLYGEMKRLCILIIFPFLSAKQNNNQVNGIEGESCEFNEMIRDEHSEKNPNDIIIAA